MKYSFRRQSGKKEKILRSGILNDLKGLLCLSLAVLMINTCVIVPAADTSAAEILRVQDDSTTEEESVSDEYEEFDEVIEETTEEEEDTSSEDPVWDNDPENETGVEDALFADEDGLITDPDLVDDPAEADLSGMDDFVDGDVMTIVMDDPIVSDPGQASGNSGSGKRLLKSARNIGSFTNYYDQLEEPAQTFYDLRKSYFADGRQTGTLSQQFSKPESEGGTSQLPASPCSFLCDIVPKTDSDGNPTGNWTYDNTCDRFKTGYEELLYYVRASFDAFYYDHPEVFWTRSTSLGFSFGGYNLNTDERTATVYLSKITLIPVAAYENAASQVAEFDQAVAETALQISTASDYDGDGTVSRPELLQGIHDFLCLRCYYDNDGLSTYKTTGDYSIFTPGPVFLETRAGVVCEGYSRAFKILCDYFGFACAIVSGKAHTYSAIGHAWNAVDLDENWYMIDTTWDDVADLQEEIKYQYYLCALNTSNYGSNQLSDRAVNGKIGGNDTTSTTSAGLQVTTRKKVFEFPSYWSGAHAFVETGLNGVPGGEETETVPACVTLFACNEQGHEAVRYYKVGHDWDGGVIETPASCEEAGTLRYTCRNNPNHTKTQIIPATGHDWNDGVIISEATCTLPGIIRYICNNDASHTYEDEIPIDKDAHDWDGGSVTKESTCVEPGILTYTCRYNEGHTKTEEIPVNQEAHDWDEGSVTKKPTCNETGIRTYTCKYSEGHTKTEEIPIDQEAHDWGEGTVTKEPTCNETGIRTYTCNYSESHTKTEKIPIDQEAHDWDEGTVIKPASCTETGILQYTCKNNLSHIKTEIIPATGHNWGDWETVKEASDKEDGIEIRVCRNSGSHLDVRTIPALKSDNIEAGEENNPETKITADREEGGTETETMISAPGRPVWRSVSAKGSGKILARWKKVKGASGYELQISSRRTFKKKYTVTFMLRSSRYYRTIRKLKKGRKYYIRIRAFTQEGEFRLNSPWSHIRSAKAG